MSTVFEEFFANFLWAWNKKVKQKNIPVEIMRKLCYNYTEECDRINKIYC